MDDVIKAAKAVCEIHNDRGGLHFNDGKYQEAWDRWRSALAALRTALAAHEAAPTVAVPVATLRDLIEELNYSVIRDPSAAAAARRVCDEITKFLPPPPAPEPSEELVAEWEREAELWSKSRFLENQYSARVGYVAARRAEWAKKGGG